MLAHARHYCRDESAAEDLASESFVETIAAVGDGAGPAEAWRPYLFTAAHRLASSWATRSHRERLSADFAAWAGSGEPGRRTEDSVMHREEQSLVAAAFHSLSERWQAVLWHTEIEQTPGRELSIILGVSPSGLTSLKLRAREGLREAYLSAHAGRSGSEECRHYSSRLGALVRRPDSRRSKDLTRHLSSCQPCASALAELQAINTRLGTLLPIGVLLWRIGTITAERGAGTGREPGSASAAGTKAGRTARPRSHDVVGIPSGSLIRPLAGAAAVAAACAAAAWIATGPPGVARVPVSAPGPARTTAAPEPASPSPGGTPAQTAGRKDRTKSTERPPSSGAVNSSPPPSPVLSPQAPVETSGSARPATTLRVGSTGRCMQIGDATGAQPEEAECTTAAEQLWTTLASDNGVYLRNEASGMCLTHTGSRTDGAPVTQQACGAAPRGLQQWNTYFNDDQRVTFSHDGLFYLGLNDWSEAAQILPHEPTIGTTANYYGSPSFSFLYEGNSLRPA
ncbi:RICIN domain-containing protein [Streptomyces sp. MUM 136J]|nr:RICIN domain-containing protein [Streptomyces sp. MUM 136J]